jgi:hypothetical protein
MLSACSWAESLLTVTVGPGSGTFTVTAGSGTPSHRTATWAWVRYGSASLMRLAHDVPAGLAVTVFVTVTAGWAFGWVAAADPQQRVLGRGLF